MSLDPVLGELIRQMNEAGGPALNEMSPVDAREMYRGMQEALPFHEVHQVTDEDADGVQVRIYRPSADRSLPCLVFFHGGGWVIGDLETHDSVCRQLANQVQCVVIAVDYRLAPEHPYPAALEDCYHTVQWAVDNAHRLDIDPTRVAVGGDSAGGNLAACVCLKSRQEGGPPISFQLLIYPVTDTAMDTSSYEENREGYLLTRDSMSWFMEQYLGTASDNRLDPLAAPLRAPDFSNLPGACIITAEFDPLRDEGEHLAARLDSSGVHASLRHFDGMIHGFFGMTHLVEGARDAMDFASRELRDAFNDG